MSIYLWEKLSMRNTLLFLSLISLVPVFVVYSVAVLLKCDPLSTYDLYCSKLDTFPSFYAANIRGHVFAGFLALGGFLLSLKTFIVINMKQNLYDNPEYQKLHEKTQKRSKIKKTLYEPLKELSDILFYAISASLLAALLQMTLGLYEVLWASITCMYFCMLAAVLLFYSLLLIKQNLDVWFTHIDK